MPDEYVDIHGTPPELFSLAIDPNSMMGTKSSSEYCYAANHLCVSDPGGSCDDAESMWTLLVDQYTVLPSVDSGGLKVGRYLDVLHKLRKLLDISIQ